MGLTTDYRMQDRPDGPTLTPTFVHRYQARDPWTDYALQAWEGHSSADRQATRAKRWVRVFRALPAEHAVLNPGGEWVTFDPHFAFTHAYGVARRQRRAMHVVTALVRRSEMRYLHGWFGSAPVTGAAVTTPPVLGTPCTAAEIHVGDWMALPSTHAVQDSPQFWRRCVDRDLESVWWEAPACRIPIPLDDTVRVSHRLPSGVDVAARYFDDHQWQKRAVVAPLGRRCSWWASVSTARTTEPFETMADVRRPPWASCPVMATLPVATPTPSPRRG